VAVAGHESIADGLLQGCRHLEFVIGAAALYWRPRPASLMRAQLDRISAVAALANVRIGVIPLGTEVPDVWCNHSFNIFDDREDAQDPFVHVETLTTPVNVTDRPMSRPTGRYSCGSRTQRSPGMTPSGSSPKSAAPYERIIGATGSGWRPRRIASVSEHISILAIYLEHEFDHGAHVVLRLPVRPPVSP
jgi:Domain of unknown function (DUF5753)